MTLSRRCGPPISLVSSNSFAYILTA
jgi:FAD/FMN-containing dehydrogenase